MLSLTVPLSEFYSFVHTDVALWLDPQDLRLSWSPDPPHPAHRRVLDPAIARPSLDLLVASFPHPALSIALLLDTDLDYYARVAWADPSISLIVVVAPDWTIPFGSIVPYPFPPPLDPALHDILPLPWRPSLRSRRFVAPGHFSWIVETRAFRSTHAWPAILRILPDEIPTSP